MFGFGFGGGGCCHRCFAVRPAAACLCFHSLRGSQSCLQDRYCPSKTCLHRVHRPAARFAVRSLATLQRERTHPEAYFALPKPQLPATLVGSCFSETQLCPSRVRHHNSPPATENEEPPPHPPAATAPPQPQPPSHRSASGRRGFPLLQEDPRQNFSSSEDGFSRYKKQDPPPARSNKQPDATCREALPLRRGPRQRGPSGLPGSPSLRPGQVQSQNLPSGSTAADATPLGDLHFSTHLRLSCASVFEFLGL